MKQCEGFDVNDVKFVLIMWQDYPNMTGWTGNSWTHLYITCKYQIKLKMKK